MRIAGNFERHIDLEWRIQFSTFFKFFAQKGAKFGASQNARRGLVFGVAEESGNFPGIITFR